MTELILAIALFMCASIVFSKYLLIDDNTSTFLVFLKGVIKAIMFMSIILMVSFFLPDFSWKNIPKFLLVTVVLALVSGILEVVRRGEL